jgi:hypothetical protein
MPRATQHGAFALRRHRRPASAALAIAFLLARALISTQSLQAQTFTVLLASARREQTKRVYNRCHFRGQKGKSGLQEKI